MNVLVTGPDGFVGSAVCTKLLAEGQTVRGAQWKAVPLPEGCESVVVADINAQTDWTKALVGIDAVVHLAARVHVMDDTAEDPLAAFRAVNVEGTRRLAQEAAKAGVKRFVFISSIKVNGEATQRSGASQVNRESLIVNGEASAKPECDSSEVRECTNNSTNEQIHFNTNELRRAFSEKDTPSPEDPYGQSKHEAEVALREIGAETGMEVVILRPPLLYGPGVKANFLKLIQLVDKGVPLPLGGIRNKRSLLGLTNFADLISNCVTDPRAAGQTFMVCDGDDISSPELVRRIARALGKKPRLIPVPEGVVKLAGKLTGKSAKVDRLCDSLVIDSSHVRKTLDWTPPLSMDEELAKVAKWFRTLR